MADSIVARQQGDDFQASFFWLEASKLYQPCTNVEAVEWESKISPTGFDDVVVRYKPGIIDGKKTIQNDSYQLKFHVDHNRGLTYEAFAEPEFIGTTKATILTRLFDAFRQDQQIAEHTRLNMINSWGIDRNNPIGALICNDGSLKLNLLFRDSSDNTKYGKIRKLWREHLCVSDDVLKQVLEPFRIWPDYLNAQRQNDYLNARLELAGLKPVDGEKMIRQYNDLIRRLHKAGETVFTRENLKAVCEKEGLVLPPPVLPEEEKHTIGIRSFKRGAETLHLEVNDHLCLLDKFSGRFLSEDVSWKTVAGLLVPFTDRAIAVKKPLCLQLDTHLSVAFAAGYFLDSKSGVPVTVVQKVAGRKLNWSPRLTSSADRPGIWNWHEQTLSLGGKDIVLAISATHDIREQAQAFAAEKCTDAAKVITCTIQPMPSNTAFQDADHIRSAIYALIHKIRGVQSVIKGIGLVHLLMAAPNAFAFFLGQHAKPLGKITLYEFDFERQRDGGYQPSISLPL
jgi:hypothetical protein